MIKFILLFFSIFPLRINHFIGTLIGRYLYFSKSKPWSVTRKNIAICFPDLTQSQQNDLIKSSLIEDGKSLSESGPICLTAFSTIQKHVRKTTGLSHLQSDRPILLLVPHFGCWEITGRVLSLVKPITSLYKPGKNKQHDALLMQCRQQGDLTMVGADRKGVMQLQRAMRNGSLIGILPDQYPGEGAGVVAPFFNQDTYSMTLLSKLARKHDAKVIMTWAKRLDKGRGYELHLEPVEILSEKGTLVDDVCLMNKAIEKLVRTCPEQYLWSYKRFKPIIKY